MGRERPVVRVAAPRAAPLRSLTALALRLHGASAMSASRLPLAGTFTALVTPFSPDGGEIDLAALDALVEAQIEGGVTGLVPCGTTGETPTLTEEEQIAVIKRVVATAKGRALVLAGTGSFSTKKSIAASKAALEAGADAVMIVMPYYSKPSQDGLREHVLAIAREVSCPIVLYNIPGRSVVDLSADTTARICDAAPTWSASRTRPATCSAARS